ncbi:hypothetical protein [Holzapfeliella floricola]|nr:hypothetical protein [Holzapfeliella floricola]
MKKQQKTKNNYEKRALLSYLNQFQHQLEVRHDLAEGELDGRLWNHEQW